MQRPNAYVALVRHLFTLVILVALGFWGWQQRSLLFSPGRLSAKKQPGVILQGFSSHAEFEKECKRCHQSLKTQQAFLCTDCHTNISEEIKLQDGVHGKLETALHCEECHSDHKGEDFDPGRAALEFFDHDITGFRIIRHQFDFDAVPLVCSRCHRSPEFDAGNQACEDCHLASEAEFMPEHLADFGKDCLACHDGADSMARFDHTQTSFLLEGLHEKVTCAACHVNGQFQDMQTGCETCHTEPVMHAGLFSQSCDTCHSVNGWLPALLDNQPFEHATSNFSLTLHAQDYDGQPLNCATCHQDGSENFEMQICITCHQNGDAGFMDQHLSVFGSNCLNCHDGIDRYSNFQHDDFFLLKGKHSSTACDLCHADFVFQGTASLCSECHTEPPIHANWFGLKCENCHSDEAWAPAAMIRHLFPLEHGSAGLNNCVTCHLNKYTEYTCYGCHDHEKSLLELNHFQAGVSIEELPNCVLCHSVGKVE